MITELATYRRSVDGAQLRDHLTTQTLRDDEVRAIANSAYREDNPLRFEGVRHAALMFERAGYAIVPSEDIRPTAVQPQAIIVGCLVVDALRRVVLCDQREITLRAREFDLLEVLARHPGQVFRRSQLLDLAWPRGFEGDERTVDTHVVRIRRRLGEPKRPHLIVTIPGVGYKLAAPRTSCAA